MRGKGSAYCWYNVIDRITPAYAGKSKLVDVGKDVLEDHPRLCGEKQLAVEHIGHYLGITPAYAGKSVNATGAIANNKDHPRLCGEKRFHDVLLIFRRGSPPPMRGKVTFRSYPIASAGITPAYAGKRTHIHIVRF